MTTPTDQQVIEILAKREGWTLIDGVICDPKPEIRHGVQTGDVDINPVAHCPDYLSDLNALQPILAGLTDEEWERLDAELLKAVINDYPIPFIKLILTMKPSQLARCIVKAINKETI